MCISFYQIFPCQTWSIRHNIWVKLDDQPDLNPAYLQKLSIYISEEISFWYTSISWEWALPLIHRLTMASTCQWTINYLNTHLVRVTWSCSQQAYHVLFCGAIVHGWLFCNLFSDDVCVCCDTVSRKHKLQCERHVCPCL